MAFPVVFGRTLAAAGLVVGVCAAAASSPAVVVAEPTMTAPGTGKVVIDEKVTKGQDGFEFTGTVSCPENESPVEFTRVVLAVKQDTTAGVGESDTVECDDGGQGRAPVEGKWKVVVETEQQQPGSAAKKPVEWKPGKAEAYVAVIQGTQFSMAKGPVTFSE
ncbi:hypothetical protein FHS29_004795 [Saccharothrix tamanrassetensis]|uniref:Uncharacterized protein n=1 Tax=Saccharothrix tamanrassetensis TaxID=1051531 RepID=A0A841CQ44_9PSEU|nr:hypothetical protein [Saccharothrix tamanrassetensis]MBB5958187.1 hypothetical protein [Saccharothrix tamanrassetensis]